jgi:hypothetical protein
VFTDHLLHWRSHCWTTGRQRVLHALGSGPARLESGYRLFTGSALQLGRRWLSTAGDYLAAQLASFLVILKWAVTGDPHRRTS